MDDIHDIHPEDGCMEIDDGTHGCPSPPSDGEPEFSDECHGDDPWDGNEPVAEVSDDDEDSDRDEEGRLLLREPLKTMPRPEPTVIRHPPAVAPPKPAPFQRPVMPPVRR